VLFGVHFVINVCSKILEKGLEGILFVHMIRVSPLNDVLVFGD
jgi:hypothetical protein